MKSIATRVSSLRQKIAVLERKYQRKPGSVRLLAVSKTRDIETIREAIRGGQQEFGENYIQEALTKIEDLVEESISWHFIGPVQSNKTKAIAEHFDWVHSVDRLKIARRLNDARSVNRDPLNVCLQVNISGEPSKSGVPCDELPELINACGDLSRLRIRGLMTLPEPDLSFEEQRHSFRQLRELFQSQGRPGFDTLSMGTTQDIEAAIAEGSTLVRIGTAIFGPRQ